MAETLAIHGGGLQIPQGGLKKMLEEYERTLILDALARAGGNQRRAAAALGCLPTTLNEKMRRLGLREVDREQVAEATADGDS
jgi:DNA-binding NtrC family response regulator